MGEIFDLTSQIEATCRFCNPPEKERILYESDNYYIMVSLGAFVEGYLLIVTKKHVGASFNIPKEYLDEFLELKKMVSHILEEVYGYVLFYEHGKAGSSLTFENSSKHCYHTHLHCIPSNIQLNQDISKELQYKSYKSFEEAYEDNTNTDKYLYVEDNVVHVYKSDSTLRKQYLRYKLSTALKIENEWDWIKFQNWDNINKTITILKPYFR